MSEKLFKFALAELLTVRISCQKEGRGKTLEVPVDKLNEIIHNGICPLCHQNHLSTFSTQLGILCSVFQNLIAHKSDATIQFVLPDGEESK